MTTAEVTKLAYAVMLAKTVEETEALLAAAFEKVRARAALLARLQERRWTCKKMKSVCESIGTAIERDEE